MCVVCVCVLTCEIVKLSAGVTVTSGPRPTCCQDSQSVTGKAEASKKNTTLSERDVVAHLSEDALEKKFISAFHCIIL